MAEGLVGTTIVGELYVDHVLAGLKRWPDPGEEVHATGYHCDIGGGAAITACALGRLGRPVKVVGVVGVGQATWIKSRLGTFGVDPRALCVVDEPSGVTVAVSTRADRSFFTYYGANGHLENHVAQQQIVDQLTASRHVHFAMPLSRGLAGELLPVLREAGCHMSLDVGYHPAWFRDRTNWATCGEVDCLMANEKEAELLCGASATSDYFACANQIGMKHRIVKLGARGAQGEVDGKRISVRALSVDPVDTTGAGDAFDAGYIDAWFDGLGMRERLQRGCVCGGFSVQGSGGVASLPDRSTLACVEEATYGS